MLYRRCFVVCFFLLVGSSPLLGGDVLPPASNRFADASGDEDPSLRRHVLPLLGRLGCNGRACHGSFQGQGGFRLSLFGYDFAADHEALLGGDQPRVDREHPASSLIVAKPTLTVDHDGGRRFEKDSWQHRLLQRWIQAGARGLTDDEPEFDSLTVEPAEIVFDKPGKPVALRAVVRWSDGSSEDVTPLCRFRSNDDSIATVSDTGMITAAGK